MGRCFRGLLSAFLFSSADSARISTEVFDKQEVAGRQYPETPEYCQNACPWGCGGLTCGGEWCGCAGCIQGCPPSAYQCAPDGRCPGAASAVIPPGAAALAASAVIPGAAASVVVPPVVPPPVAPVVVPPPPPVPLSQPVWNFNGMTLNPDSRGALLPGLVPPPGTTFEVVNREMELGVGSVSNDYQWAFLTIEQGGNTIPVNQWFAQISGEGFFGVFAGTRRTVVRNNLGQDLFVIEAARATTSTSWRIRHPLTNAILFTINKDFWGAGFFWARDEWRIYRGRERDADQIYYVVADYSAHRHRFYHNEAEYQNSATPAAQSQFYTRGGTYTQGFISDSIGVRVGPGEDTALILSTTIVIDMLNEVRAANARAAEARRQEEELTGHRRRRGTSDRDFDVYVSGSGRRRSTSVALGGSGISVRVGAGAGRRRGGAGRRRGMARRQARRASMRAMRQARRASMRAMRQARRANMRANRRARRAARRARRQARREGMMR